MPLHLNSAARLRLSSPEKLSVNNYAGPPGLEPGTSVLETEILPLNYRPFCEEYSSIHVTHKAK